MLKLKFNNSERSVWLIGPKMDVGSSNNCELTINEPGILPHHARLLIDGDVIEVAEVEGAESFINGSNVVGIGRIEPGDILTIGDLDLTIVDPKQERSASKQTLQDSVSALNKKTASQLEAMQNKPKTGANGNFLADGWKLQGDIQLYNNRYPIESNFSIGRSPDNDLTLDFDFVSRKHAMLHINGSSLVIQDLNSSNGTMVNGRKIHAPTVLEPTDQVQIGKVKLTVIGPLLPKAMGMGGDSTELLDVSSIQDVPEQAPTVPITSAQSAVNEKVESSGRNRRSSISASRTTTGEMANLGDDSPFISASTYEGDIYAPKKLWPKIVLGLLLIGAAAAWFLMKNPNILQ